ncbi:MAG TPA: hypothetical protein VKD25_08800 [Burkholderiales bacterium]|nr:hypothetical protein [Burkholderiales bacterium]
MPASVAVPLILGGATTAASLYGASKQSGAAREASEAQAQSAREALALQRDIYQQTRSDLAPYTGAGTQGLTALTSFLGLPAPPASAGTLDPSRVNPRVDEVPIFPASFSAGREDALARLLAPWGPGGKNKQNPHATQWLEDYQRWKAGQGARGSGGTPTTSPTVGSAYGGAPGGTVMLRAPTGQTQAVPADQVDFYLARGATRV